MRRATFGVAAVVVLAACSESPTGFEGDRLTRAEAEAVADGIAQSGSTASGSMSSQSVQMDGVAAPPTTITTQHESSHPCPRGGSIGVELDATLTFDGEARSFSLDAEGELTHADCAYQHEGVTITVDGDPNVSYEAHAAAQNGQPQGNWTSQAEGGFKWTASDGRSGSCVVDLSDVTDFAARKRTVEGQVCGHTISRVVSWSQ